MTSLPATSGPSPGLNTQYSPGHAHVQGNRTVRLAFINVTPGRSNVTPGRCIRPSAEVSAFLAQENMIPGRKGGKNGSDSVTYTRFM